AVSKLIGAPPGYVGYDEGGQLTEAVRRKPYSVILLDEIEKAHPDVFNILLQILEDGRLTDSHGRTVNFKNTVVIMTSNLGSEHIIDFYDAGGHESGGHASDGQEAEGRSFDRMRSLVLDILKKSFRPEFLNRIDEVVVFHSLSKDNIVDITRLQLEYLVERMSERAIRVEFHDSAVTLLADRGYDINYGARPLKRVVQNLIETPLAKELIKGSFSEGDTIVVDEKGGEIVFKKK
ncbi:MAG TPA: AAA family ATPase, partial [Spirochaetota bacterium]|nr:AAA family ATPase [Spirochaetota bacterium]